MHLELLNKSFYSSHSNYSKFDRIDRTPMIKIKQKKKNINNCSSEKLLEGIKEKLNNIGIDNKQNMKNNEDTETKNQLKDKLRKIVNNNFYGTNKSKKKNNKEIAEDIIILKSEKINEKNIIENEIKDDQINQNENVSESQEKIKQNNIEILNTFLLEYITDNKGEKIIKKSIEIPYYIIIDKKAVSFYEIENHTNQKSNETEGGLLKSNKRKNKFLNTQINKTESFFLSNSQIEKTNDESKTNPETIKNEKENLEVIEIKSD